MKTIILFDGPSTSGKTIYSSELKKLLNCDIIDYDSIWQEVIKTNKKNIDKKTETMIIDKIKKSEENIIILDIWLDFQNIVKKHFPTYKIYTILIYADLKKVIYNLKKRSSQRRVKDILNQWTETYRKTEAKKYLDTIEKKDIKKLINSSRWRKGNVSTGESEFINEKDKINYYNKITREFKFGEKDKINIKPVYKNYHLIIKTKQLDPKKGAKFISNELCLDKLLEIK